MGREAPWRRGRSMSAVRLPGSQVRAAGAMNMRSFNVPYSAGPASLWRAWREGGGVGYRRGPPRAVGTAGGAVGGVGGGEPGRAKAAFVGGEGPGGGRATRRPA